MAGIYHLIVLVSRLRVKPVGRGRQGRGQRTERKTEERKREERRGEERRQIEKSNAAL